MAVLLGEDEGDVDVGNESDAGVVERGTDAAEVAFVGNETPTENSL